MLGQVLAIDHRTQSVLFFYNDHLNSQSTSLWLPVGQIKIPEIATYQSDLSLEQLEGKLHDFGLKSIGNISLSSLSNLVNVEFKESDLEVEKTFASHKQLMADLKIDIVN